MKTLQYHAPLLCMLLYVFLLTKEHFFFTSILITTLLWIHRTKDTSFLYFISICMLASFPIYDKNEPSFQQAVATEVTGTYAILQNKNQRVLVYTDTPLQLDAIYTCKQEFQPILSSKSFYNFNSENWAYTKGVNYTIDEENIHLEKIQFSFRHTLQTMISKKSSSNQPLLYKILLNIKIEDIREEDWFYENGFTYAGMLGIIEMILHLFLYEKDCKKISICITFLLCCIYRFPLLLTQALLFRFLQTSKLAYASKVGIVLTCIQVLYPTSITSASFLIPAIYRLQFLFTKQKKIATFTLIAILQTYLFQAMNPIKNILYPYLKTMYGCMYFLCILYLFTSIPLHVVLSSILQAVLPIIDAVTIHGSILGFGLPFFIIFISCFLHSKYYYQVTLCTFTLFLITGLFHPFAEMSIINVGQGDSILLRAPLNQTNILIDTGKQSAYKSLQTFLKAKSIAHLDALIVTHSDIDHSENMESILSDYTVDTCITKHMDKLEIDNLILYDINPITNEDTNQSSIVNITKINHTNVCLMADADSYNEDSIVQTYQNLSCDVLKVGHHGSKTSTSDVFLDTVKPKVALISSGKNNLYHHPSQEVLQRLAQRKIPYFDTQTSGDITIVFFPWFSVFITASFEIGFLF